MYKYEDSYLNQLEERANKLLKNSSSSEQSSFHNMNTIDPYQQPKSHLKSKTANTKHLPSKRSPSQSYSKTISHNSDLETRHVSFKPQYKPKPKLTNTQQISDLKQYIKQLQIQNQILRKNQGNQQTRRQKQQRTVQDEMRKFKKEMKGKLEEKFSMEIEVWIKKLKKVEKEKAVLESQHRSQMQKKDVEIERVKDEKRQLKKRLKRLNKVILKDVPAMSAEIKANTLLVESCINKYYPQ